MPKSVTNSEEACTNDTERGETLGAKGANVCRWIINALGRIQRRKWVRALNHSDALGGGDWFPFQ